MHGGADPVGPAPHRASIATAGSLLSQAVHAGLRDGGESRMSSSSRGYLLFTSIFRASVRAAGVFGRLMLRTPLSNRAWMVSTALGDSWALR